MNTSSPGCPACSAPVPPGARFCPECGARIEIASGERRILTIVFAQVVGGAGADGDLEEHRRATATVADAVSAVIDRFGGSVDKVMTDTIMAVWGAPTAHEDDPERAVRAALEMRRLAEGGSLGEVGVRIGITTGEAIWTPVGPTGAFTALGDAVNTAARLEQAAPVGDILVGAPTAEAIGNTLTFEPVPPIEAKNKSDPLIAFRAIDIATAQVDGGDAGRSPFIGREAPLGQLRDRWQRAIDTRKPAQILVQGAPGIGKSRLVREFVSALGPEVRVLRGHCLAYGEGITYWPIIEMIKAEAGILVNEDESTMSSKLGAFLEGLDIADPQEQRLVAVALANLIAAPRTPRGTYSAANVSKGELHAGVRRLVERLAEERPTILIFEDLHAAEKALLDLADAIAAATAPVAIVGTSRPPEDETGARTGEAWEELPLDPLSAEHARALLGTLTGGSGDGLDPLLNGADGNPLFLEEIVRMARETGAIGSDGEVAPGAMRTMGVPASLNALIGSRLDGMSANARRIAGRAAVVGSIFWLGALDAKGHDADTIQAALDELAVRGIVRELPSSTIAGQREFAFKNNLFLDVAYARLPKGERARLHEACARWITGLGRRSEFVEFEAYHLEQACRLTKDLPGEAEPPLIAAAEALIASAERARGRQGVSEADRFLERALDISRDVLPEMTLEITLRRTKVQLSLGDIAGALEQLRACAATAEQMDRYDLRANALADLAQLTSMTSNDRALAWSYAQEASRLARELARPRLEVITRMREGDLHLDEGATEQAIDAYEEVIDRARHEIEDRSIEISASLRLATLLLNSGAFPRAERLLAKTLDLATEHGNLREQGITCTLLAAIKYFTGPHPEAVELAERGVRSFELSPDRMMHVQALDLLAKLALHDGDDGAALARAERARALAGASSVIGADLDALLVRILLRQQRFEEARVLADDLAARAEGGDAGASVPAMLTAAYVATADGDPERFAPRYEEAIAALRQAGARMDEAEALIAMGRALSRAGSLDAARVAFAEAAGIFGSSDATAMMDVIERELAALPNG